MGRDLDLRVSDIPTTWGESIVMRILDKSGVMLGISELGFFPDDQETINNVIHFPDGIFLVTGPTGSGKTTSLYSFLHALNQPVSKIITAEDPVEYELSGINQVQINSDIGMTFANALRAMLRQAPNIIMVGEIRDDETGEIAINAALTGHLVLSTLHTNDSVGAVNRLVDMGIEPFLVASSVEALTAQRLIRRLCPRCKRPWKVDKPFLQSIGFPLETLKDGTICEPVGCEACHGTGYSGRTGIYEILTVTDEIRQMVVERKTSGEIKEYAVAHGMHTLRMDGWRKVLAGITTLEEVLRVTSENES